MNRPSADRLMESLLAALANRDDPDYAIDALRAFLTRYGEARTECVYEGRGLADDGAGVALPPFVYYPLDARGRPVVVGKRYRREDGSTLAVDRITLGRDAGHTTIYFTDGSHAPASRLAPVQPRVGAPGGGC